MRVLVATASRHGATREIGARIGAVLSTELTNRGLDSDIDVVDAAQVHDMGAYDAAIIGSGIYFGRWLSDARKLIDNEEYHLLGIPVWLFSSGPIGDDTRSTRSPVTAPWAREHRTFPGKLDRSALNVGERLVASLLRVPDVDGRDFADIESWAREIAAGVSGDAPSGTTR